MRKSTFVLDFISSTVGSRLLLVLLSTFLNLKCACPQNLDQNVKTLPMKFSHEKSLVYGPGLQKNFNMPVRYFFIQAVDISGENFTGSPSGKLEVHITGYKQNCRIWTQLFDRKNGHYIARYKLYHQCSAVEINIKYDDQPVRDSPYIVEGPLYHEHCYCPVSLPKWLDLMSCYGNYSQIHADLSSFPQIDMEMTLDSAIKRFNMPGAISFCHYSVIKNEIYRKCYGQHVGFNMFMDAILLSLTRKIQLPNLEMLVNLGDWPLEKRLLKDGPIPFFSWCGSKDTRDIVMPTYDITEATLEMMGRVTLDIFSVMGNSGPEWENKVEKGFWRGRDSRQERLDLVKMGRKHPDVIDAALTNFFFFREQEKELGPKVSHVSFFDFFKYKYQINIDGTVAAYRFPYLLAGSGVVLKQESDYYEHFYHQMEPMVHYIPFKRDLSDLIKKLEWAKSHDADAQRITKNAQQFALDHLLPKEVFCYHMVLFQEYAKRLIKPPRIVQGMEHVPQPKNKPLCSCPSVTEKAERDEL